MGKVIYIFNQPRGFKSPEPHWEGGVTCKCYPCLYWRAVTKWSPTWHAKTGTLRSGRPLLKKNIKKSRKTTP